MVSRFFFLEFLTVRELITTFCRLDFEFEMTLEICIFKSKFISVLDQTLKSRRLEPS